MEPFANYLLKSAVWLTGFSAVYFLFLRNERFFRLKRIWLITGLLVSLLFPLITFHYNVEIAAPHAVVPAEYATITPGIITAQPVTDLMTFDYRALLLVLYLSGLGVLFIRIIIHITSLSEIIRKTGICRRGPARIVRTTGFTSPFSFFNYVFINPALPEPEAEEILNHEAVHIKQKHWFDLLLAEVLRMVQWINPFAWVYTGFIRQNHEYLADETALQQTSDPANYRAVLVNQLFRAPVIALSNPFSYSKSKKRFDMMKKIITSPYRKLKLLLVLPVIATLFYAFATPEYHYASPVIDNPIMIFEALPITQKSVKGFVLNDNNKPMFGVKITVEGVVAESFTKQNGSFEIAGAPAGSSLEFTFGGYRKLTLPADFSKVMEVKMVKEPVITSEKAKYVPPPPPPPPQEQKDPEPMVLVDGVVREEGLKGIDPNAISSLAILKDKSATAVFGDKGKNGVIVVVLKEGMSFSGKETVVVQKSAYIPPPPPPPPPAPQAQQQGPEPLVVIDGVVTDKKYRDAVKELSYNFGLTKRLMGTEATNKYGDKGNNGVYEITTRKKALEMGLKPPFPRLAPEDYPTFQGEKASKFTDWIVSQLKYPAEAQTKNIDGWVSASYTIELDGTVSNVIAVNPIVPVLTDEVVRIIKSSPKWDPPKNPDVDEPYVSPVMLRFKLPDQILTQAPFVVVDKMPTFPGGPEALLKFISDNINYPESARANNIQGKVIVRFIVNTEGKAEAASILKGVDPLLDAEALRIVKILPLFKPGSQGGSPVNVYYMVPVSFAP